MKLLKRDLDKDRVEIGGRNNKIISSISFLICDNK